MEELSWRENKPDNWIATVLIDSKREKDPTKNSHRLKDFYKIIENICRNRYGDGIILFPAGYFHTGEDEPRTYYNTIKDAITPTLDASPSHVFVCVGIDGRWHRERNPNQENPSKEDAWWWWDQDQIAVAIDRDNIQAIGRKFHLRQEESERNKDTGIPRVQKAEYYDDRYRENGKSRFFTLNNSRYYLAVCYDGYAHQRSDKYERNPGTDVILNLIHRFPKKGEGSGLSRQVNNGFKGISEMWKCPIFGSAIFINRPDPIRRWPSAGYCPDNFPRGKCGNYDDIPISSDDIFSMSEQGIRLNDSGAIVKIYQNYQEKIQERKCRYALQSAAHIPNSVINRRKSDLNQKYFIPDESRNAWNEQAFIAVFREKCGEENTKIIERLTEWAKKQNMNLEARNKSFFPFLKFPDGTGCQIFRLTTDGWIEFQFKYMIHYNHFNDVVVRSEWLRLINKIPGMNFTIDCLQNEKLPRRSISLLKESYYLDLFIQASNYFINVMTAPHIVTDAQ